jgi:hypothetical protein
MPQKHLNSTGLHDIKSQKITLYCFRRMLWYSTLKLEAVLSSYTYVSFYQTTRRYVTED